MNKFTIFTHIYNEEYLLPFWLEHHKKIFDHGVIIDYCSTDRSVEIIKEICPTWEIITTKNIDEHGNPSFGAEEVEIELCSHELRFTGFKLILCITEFLLISDKYNSINNLLDTFEIGYYYLMKCYSILGSSNINNKEDIYEKDKRNEIIEYKNHYPKNIIEFFKDIKYISHAEGRGYHAIHSDPHGKYFVGRNALFNVPEYNKIYLNNCIILWCGYYPYNKEMYKRKIQIQKNIPNTDRLKGYGIHHLVNIDDLKQKYIEEMDKSISIDKYDKNITDIIKSYT